MNPKDLQNDILDLNTFLEPNNLACSLTSFDEHASLLQKVSSAIISQEFDNSTFTLEFAYTADTSHLVLDFVVKEQVCCPFFDFDLQFRKNPDTLKLKITSAELSRDEFSQIIRKFITI